MKSIVIGSGFGDIATTLRLKIKNHKVNLIEKHPDLSWCTGVFKKNGFNFNCDLTVITVSYLINKLFEFNDAILKVIFIGLASLTFPHILLEYLLEKNEK